MDHLNGAQYPSGFVGIGKARAGDPVPGHEGWVYQPLYDTGSQFKAVYDMASVSLQLIAQNDIRGAADQQWNQVGFVPVHISAIDGTHRLQHELHENQRLVSEYRAQAERAAQSVDRFADVADAPEPAVDSHAQIVGDDLGTQYKANISFQHDRLISSLRHAKDTALRTVEHLREQFATDDRLQQAGDHAARGQSSLAAQSTESRLGRADQHRVRTGLLREAERQHAEAERLYNEAVALADEFKDSANKAVDWIKTHKGRDLVGEVERLSAASAQLGKARSDLAAALRTSGEQADRIDTLQGEVDWAKFQRNLSIGLLIVALIGLAVAGTYIMRSHGHTPVENWLKSLSPDNLKMLEYVGIGAAAIGVGAVTIYGAKKIVPAAWHGVKAAGSAIADACPFQLKGSAPAAATTV